MNRLAAWTLLVGVALLAAVAWGDEPGEEPAPRVRDFDGHVSALRERLPGGGEGWTIVVEKPFVVVGDEEPARVRRHAERTVKWAVDHLKKAYFEEDPADIIDVYLLKDAESYRKHSEELFGLDPTSPYGYYTAVHRALVMNIATGGGTLVHEIVHAFMETNFPGCPAWFNEGLASLYEQCGERDGVLTGFVNWRLPILQAAIREGRLESFEHLCGTSREAFYGARRGVNYAQARYLCFYLQEENLLHDYYRAFREAHAEDPTGYRTLVRLLNVEDMRTFQTAWEKLVLELEFD